MDRIERFLSHVVKSDDGCWFWSGAKVRGYGQFQFSSYKTVRAHRFAYETWIGPIPAGLTLDHVCHDPELCKLGEMCPHRSCVNPSHLDPKTFVDNAARSCTKNLTHCKRGHEFTEVNTITRPSKPGHRECRTCANDRKRLVYVPIGRSDVCVRGHAFDKVTARGARGCSTCDRDYQREYQRALRAKRREVIAAMDAVGANA